MKTGRIEAFSDGVLAIVITVMVLGLKIPDDDSFNAIQQFLSTGLLGYLLSFVYVGIYWSNHHHTFQITQRVSGATLWANLSWLFVISLLPFSTSWMESSNYSRVPVIFYGINLLATSLAYFLLQFAIIRSQGEGSALKAALGKDWKGKISVMLYCFGIGFAALASESMETLGVWVALSSFISVAILWIVPDRRIAKIFQADTAPRL